MFAILSHVKGHNVSARVNLACITENCPCKTRVKALECSNEFLSWKLIPEYSIWNCQLWKSGNVGIQIKQNDPAERNFTEIFIGTFSHHPAWRKVMQTCSWPELDILAGCFLVPLAGAVYPRNSVVQMFSRANMATILHLGLKPYLNPQNKRLQKLKLMKALHDPGL